MIGRRSRLPAILLTTLLLLLGATTALAKPRDMVIWGVNLGPNSKGDEAVIREFQRRHPEMNVRVLNMGAGGMNPQKLMTAIVGNVAPDVIYQDRFTISDWASRGAFRPLDDLIARDSKRDPLCPRSDQYYPAAWAEASYQGQVYGIPYGADDRILYYNKAIFARHAADLIKAGCDPNRPPRTWTELLTYAKAITEYNPDGSLKEAGFLPNFGNTWLYLYSFETDASFISPDGRTCTLDSPESEEALNFMIKGYDQIGGYDQTQKFQSGFLNAENEAFMIGKVGMKIDGNWILDDMSRFHPEIPLGVAVPPVPDDRLLHKGRYAKDKDTFITWIGGYCYSIPKGARNVQDGWEFVKFVTSTEGREINARAQREWDRYLGRSFIPLVMASKEANAALYRDFKPADEKFAAALKQHMDMMPVGHIRPATFVGQTLWDAQVRAFETAAYKKASPKAALQEAQAAVQSDLDAFYSKSKYPVIDLQVPLDIGMGIAAIVCIGLAVWFYRLRIGRLARHEAKWAYLFISPWVIGFIVFTVGPMLASLFFSFTSYDVLNEARWVGLKNYGDMGGADKVLVLKALFNAIYLAGIGVPLGLSTGLAIALLLNTASRGIRFYRTFFYMPAIVPTVASAVLWTWVLTADPSKGLVNAGWNKTITVWLGITPPGWLGSTDYSKAALILMGMWGAGSGMILWLAGLKGVPSTLYEAAGLDGANPRQQFWNVTFPMLSPVIFFNMVMGFIGAMQEFDRVYVMKPPSDGSTGPDDSLLTPVFHLFMNGFQYFKMGYASALAWMIFGIILLLTAFQWKMAPRWVHYEADK
jgi:ABC-type sugar transport system permease subunit/ABC-type glycerol-3-phosphate transport system substrate-binding protein